MPKHKFTATVTVEYEDDGRQRLPDNIDQLVADMVVERASSHNHTKESGITVLGISAVV